MDIVDVFPEFHYFPTLRVGGNGNVAGGVEINADPVGRQGCG
ncbi:hypothetical protein [Methanoregula formicica]|nr:hypothetical protein [Methanoregula formicica]